MKLLTHVSLPSLQKQCVETACILAELGADEISVASALLKDVLLKSMMTEVQLRNLVSPAVVDLVIKVGRLDDLCQVGFSPYCALKTDIPSQLPKYATSNSISMTRLLVSRCKIAFPVQARLARRTSFLSSKHLRHEVVLQHNLSKPGLGGSGGSRPDCSFLLEQVRNDMMKASSRGDLDPKASQMFSHLLLTMADVHGVLIKLADRLAAVRKAASSLGEPGAEVAAEALEVFAPIANQLGVWSIKAELEDLAFKVDIHSHIRNSQCHHL